MQILQNVWTALTTENENLVGIISIPVTFLEAYFSMLLFTSFFKIKSTTKTKLIYICSISILSIPIRYFIPNPYGTFINIILCPILIHYIFKISILKSIFCEFFPILIETIIDAILIKIYILFFNIDSNSAYYVPVYRFSFTFVEYLVMYILYKIIVYINPNTEKLLINSKQKCILMLNCILGIVTVSTQMYLTLYESKSLPISAIILSISSLITYFAVSLYSLFSTNKLNIARQNLEETRLMNKTLTILNDKIRAFRHDFNNIIQALGGYIQAKDIDGLEKYYSQLLKDCQEVTNLTGLNPESINNPAIYSLLASKYYLATEKGIEFDLDIFMDLTSIDMKIYEFCRILGILLDNAIQATQECEEKHIKVTIRKDNRCKRQLLIVENAYKEKDIDTEKIFEKGYSTKEGNTGLGLWEVRQILLKNTNLNLFTSKDDTYFKQQLEIYKS